MDIQPAKNTLPWWHHGINEWEYVCWERLLVLWGNTGTS